ncbi:MAG: hypothetical protein AAF384_08805 [Pseudomonadota bacterium]
MKYPISARYPSALTAKCTGLRSVIGLLGVLMLGGCGSAQPDEQLRLVATPSGGEVPDIVRGQDGSLHLAYVKANDLYYVSSGDGGQSFSAPLRVNHEPGFVSGGYFRGPDIDIDRDGALNISWYNDSYAQGRKDDGGIMFSRGTADGFSAEINANKKPSDSYSLAAGEQHVALGWAAKEFELAVSSDGGKSFASPLHASAESCECCSSRLAISKGDTGKELLVYLYRNNVDNQRDMQLGLVDLGSGELAQVTLDSLPWHIEACPISGNDLTVRDGTIFVTWEREGAVYFTTAPLKKTLSPARETLVTNNGRLPAIATNGKQVLLAWKQGKTAQWRYFTPAGEPSSDVFNSEGTTTSRLAAVDTADGRFLIVH